MKVLFTSIFALFLATSAWATGEMPNPANCTESDLGASEGPLNIDLIWEPNTINTTWYSEGVQIQNAPQSCSYSSTMTLPTAPSRLGYAFAGWTLRVPQCALPTLDSVDTGTDYGYINGDSPEPYADNALAYGLTQPQTWGATFVPGNITGSAMCSAHIGNNHSYAWGGTSSDWTADTATLTGASGSATYCWCRADAFTPTNGSECEFAPQPWVFNHGFNSTTDCSETCASECAQSLRGMPGFRDAVYSVAVAPTPSQQQCLIPSTLVSTNGSSRGYKNDSTGEYGAAGLNTSDYNLTEDNTWGVTWSNGDKVTGEAFCSTTDDGKTLGETGNPGTTGGYVAGGQYCWCKATHYTANGESQCSLSSPAWVFLNDGGTASGCAVNCARNCAGNVRNNSDFRVAIFTGLIAQ